MSNWLSAALGPLAQKNYAEVISLYTAAIEENPQETSYYLYLGLAYLLAQEEEEAQATWIYAFTNSSNEQLETELATILASEAQNQENLGDLGRAWLIRVHLQEMLGEYGDNFLQLLNLEIALDQLNPEILADWSGFTTPVDEDLLLKVFLKLIYFPSSAILDFVRYLLNYLDEAKLDRFIGAAFPHVKEIAYKYILPKFAADLVEVFLEKRPRNSSLLHAAVVYYDHSKSVDKALSAAQAFYENSQLFTSKVYANYLHLFIMIKSGVWQEAQPLIDRNEQLLQQLLQEKNPSLEPFAVSGFVNIGLVLPYLSDQAASNRTYTNLVSQIVEKHYSQTNLNLTPKLINQKKLKIGYIGETFRKHSVGWLCRWLIKYHNQEEFSLAIYLLGPNHEDELTREYFQPYCSIYRNLYANAPEIAARIHADEIDILVDVDSLTSNLTCQVLALKPAPIQVTWLGWDASGLSSVDYYIGDPYVLPANAQDYYQEKIWRLPQTYLAVDGFEVGIPTLSRSKLGIPEDSVIYFSVQSALKRHPKMIYVQMQILKSVDNSCFLIKGAEDKPKVQELFREIAQAEGVAPERLYFLPRDDEEAVHRANLALADVVLDTYPYNGATTTLEVLWMEIPIVTKVGQRFSARNSYGFMLNAGISEGIAYSDEEYIDWGIRLGKNLQLRQQVAWKLRQAKTNAPVWDTPTFTKELENAYKKMAQHHDNHENPDYNVG